MPDFVDGWAFGNAVGVGLRSIEGWWNVVTVGMFGSSMSSEGDGLQIDLKNVRDRFITVIEVNVPAVLLLTFPFSLAFIKGL